ncbi:PD-(D/E)XK nuclease family transposase, partial [Amedibacillus dolichus]|uniref:PD-(D/E)XK nuclease family transposase n=1 Tax=Amedibacillus dolichus TaxID=31971 RepID=UPI002E75AE96
DFEMQTTFLQASEWKRFEYYGANMLSKQLVEGENYRQLQPIYQIIFVNACPQNEKRLINRYIMRDQYGEAESKEPLLHRIYIQLPMIDEIAKEKGMEAMNDFEQVCYLFKNNANHAILKTKERLVRKLMEKHEKFKDDEGLRSLAMSRQMAEWREKNNLLDSYDEGKKKGLEEGTQIGTTLGTVNLLALQIKQKFAIDAKEWLSTLSLSQLYELSNQLFTCNTWEELKQAMK